MMRTLFGLVLLLVLCIEQIPAPLTPINVRLAPGTGPQQSIVCPSSAIRLKVAANIAAAVSAAPRGSVFCIETGVHEITGPIVPKSGDAFIGEYGAILDGSGWHTSVPESGAFQAHNEDINDVTIKNLVIRKMPQRAIHTYSSGSCGATRCSFSTAGADRWVVENNELTTSTLGLHVSNGMVVRNNHIHHNKGSDPCGPDGRVRGGGIYSYLAQGVLFEHNDISFNACEQKFAGLSPNTIARNNWVHHNLGNGIWYDGENPGSVIENNLVEENGAMGIFYEVSGQGIIRNNTVRGNGDNGILISTSHSVEIVGNVLSNNLHGILYFVACERLGSPDGGFIGEPFFMQDVFSHDNTVTVGTQAGTFANGLSYSACTPIQLEPYINGSKNLTFTRNTYAVPSLTAPYWLWGAPLLTWSQWQALKHDTSGTVILRTQ